MFKKRGSGVLLHITSLPSKYGIGDLGPAAYRFVDFLAKAHQEYWQILPLNPVLAGAGYSPYSSPSAFAGNSLMISPEMLNQDGLLTKEEIRTPPAFPADRVDFAAVALYKNRLLDLAYARFQKIGPREAYDIFCSTHGNWLEEYTLFQSLQRQFQGRPWSDWPAKLRNRNAQAIREAKSELKDAIDREAFLQYVFFRQWQALRDYGNEREVQFIGDIAIYVGYDSADVWTHREVFQLTRQGKPKFVSGFPPDRLTPKGQLWGNPLYDWDYLKRNGYHWWIDRVRHNFAMYDVLRIDHFRGFIQYWRVPANHKTAERGQWVAGPKGDFISALVKHFAFPSLIVEVLGHLSAEIVEFIEKFDLPDMNVLIFAFEGDFASSPYYPHNYETNSVVYTGTHDTPTVRDWFNRFAKSGDKQRLCRYLGRKVPISELPWEMVRLALSSPSRLAIIPMQDLLGLGAEGRMNVPGVAKGQWRWRLRADHLTRKLTEKLAEVTETYGRA